MKREAHKPLNKHVKMCEQEAVCTSDINIEFGKCIPTIHALVQ